MAGGKETQEQTTTMQPWRPAADLITGSVLPLAQQWGAAPQSYTGPSYIEQTPEQQQALAAQRGYLQGPGQTGVVDPATAAWQQSLDPSAFMNAPGAYAPLDIYAQNVGRNLSENIRPGYAQQATRTDETPMRAASAHELEEILQQCLAELPEHLHPYIDGYTSIDVNWRGA